MSRMHQKQDFTWLLFALLVFLIVIPVGEDMGLLSGVAMRAIVFSWLLTFGIWSLRGFGKLFRLGMAFAVAGIIFNILAATLNSRIYFLASFTAVFCFILVAVWCTANQIVHDREISANRVIGTMSLYLLLGLMWAVAYAILEMLTPGAFSGLVEPLSQGWSSEWLYFSFVTMTTLGYGDITPITAIARTLAYMQAIFGQFYIAIVVAGLVSAYITEQRLT